MRPTLAKQLADLKAGMEAIDIQFAAIPVRGDSFEVAELREMLRTINELHEEIKKLSA